MSKCGEIKLNLHVTVDGEFEVGDVVELKSGGPAMTVRTICDECGEVVVNWFNFDEETGFEFFEDVFPAAALVPIEDDE